jgi:3-methylfumaryl-CoA hydratase
MSFHEWIGRSRRVSDTIDRRQALQVQAALQGALDRPSRSQQPELAAGGPLPPGWHWCWFHEAVPAGMLGEDGHERRGSFLPPVDLPRRMWAAGELNWRRPLLVGDRHERISTVEKVEEKHGRTGGLVFVTVRHEIIAQTDGEACLTERQVIVYRPATTPAAPGRNASAAALPPEARMRQVATDPVLLFRYSALTGNPHRIHYDADFCRAHEGYPGVVVHGPLTATLLMDMAGEMAGGALSRFSFRATAALFCREEITLAGWRAEDGTLSLRALTPAGAVAMEASAA